MNGQPLEFIAQHHALVFVCASSDDDADEERVVRAFVSSSAPAAAAAAVWSPRSLFKVVAVRDKLRLPPLKARLSSNQPGQHSPISPLSPGSPLYPDGLIAPVWVRKHRDLVPCALVHVAQLHLVVSSDADPLGTSTAQQREDEDSHDAALVRQLTETSALLAPRGIKQVLVVLVPARSHGHDAESIDARLASIRRQAALDSHASLFVLPLSSHDDDDGHHAFVEQVKSDLAPHAADYYREHARRVRRKRSRPPPPSSLVPQQGLTERGWAVRYEYKSAYFAEVRADTPLALKHYTDAYAALVDLFHSTRTATTGAGPATVPVLRARSKRWAEAKVLADCTAIKIAKLHLYAAAAAAGAQAQAIATTQAAAVLSRHLDVFATLSTDTWAIRTDTFEFDSWRAKQLRSFAELIALATSSSSWTVPPPAWQHSHSSSSSPATTTTPASLVPHVPAHTLAHAGLYYANAARATMDRLARFESARETFNAVNEAADGDQRQEVRLPPALEYERKVDHADLIIDLLTKAYEHYKQAHASRTTLSLARSIAWTHLAAQAPDRALTFGERVSRSHARQHLPPPPSRGASKDAGQSWARDARWTAIELDLARLCFRAACRLSKAPEATRAAFALLSVASANASRALSERERTDVQGALLELLRQCPPANDEQATIVIDSRATTHHGSPPAAANTAPAALPLLDVSAAFWRAQARTNQSVPFQVVLRSPGGLAPLSDDTRQEDALTFTSVEVHFSDDPDHPLVVRGGEASVEDKKPETIERLGRVSRGSEHQSSAALGWRAPSRDVLVLEGLVGVERATTLQVAYITLVLELNGWSVRHVIEPAPKDSWWTNELEELSFERGVISSTCDFCPRAANVKVRLEHASNGAYLDEPFAVTVHVVNEDDVSLEVGMDVLLQPGDESSPCRINVEASASSSFLSDIKLGQLKPGESGERTVTLTSAGRPSMRALDFSLRCALISEGGSHTDDVLPSTEILRSLAVPVDYAFFCSFDPRVHARRSPPHALLSLSQPTGWEDAAKVTIAMNVGALGPAPVLVEGVKLVTAPAEGQVRVLHSTLAADDFPQTWDPSDSFAAVFELEVASFAPLVAQPGFAYVEVQWRRPEQATTACTKIALPAIPIDARGLSVTVSTPPFLRVHEPARVRYAITNPTDDVLKLTAQIDSADGFVVAGPRKESTIVLAPQTERFVDIVVVPLATGLPALPRLRVFEQREHTSVMRSVQDVAEPRVEMSSHEVQVREAYFRQETTADSVERDLLVAKGEQEGMFTSLVVPGNARPDKALPLVAA